MIGALLLAGVRVFIPAGDASETITELCRQVHLQCLFDYALAHGRRTQDMHGEYVNQRLAFYWLLLGSGLAYEFVNPTTVAVTDIHHYNIAAGDACDSVNEWGEESERWYIYGCACPARARTNAVIGDFTAEEGLTRLIQGTPVRRGPTEGDGTIVLRVDCPLPPQPRKPRVRIVAPVEHSCTCAVGRWCYDETGVLNYAPSCER